MVDIIQPKIAGFAGGTLIDPTGRPISSQLIAAQDRMRLMSQGMRQLRTQLMKAKYDAAQTFVGNEKHWSNADTLGPHRANSLEVRRHLRSRSRYEVIENNPYLKGTILTLANDFVGTGPKLEITDKRLSKQRKKAIEDAWDYWCKVRKIRRKLWRMRVAKIVDGETFAIAYRNTNGEHPVQLDFQILEADQVSSYAAEPSRTLREIDGVRFDAHENPLFYHIMHQHPGDAYLNPYPVDPGGDWISSQIVIHWFRQDRGWLRGIPELTPSIPLCALLRRYTLAIVRHAETAADLTAIIETQGLPSSNPWTDGEGNELEDDPFDLFPIEIGSVMNLPRGYTVKQLNAVPLGVQFDQFVGSVLREIVRPLMVPYNVAAGTSSDSNMASGVLDSDIYKSGQKSERLDCDAEVMDKMFHLWWAEASLIPDLTSVGKPGRNGLPGHRHPNSGKFYSDAIFKAMPIQRRWRWDKVGSDHTDPAKVAQALTMLRQDKVITDRQIQEEYFNRNYEAWQEEVKEEEEFRLTLPSVKAELITSKEPAPAAPGSGKPSGKSSGNPQKSGSKSSNRKRSPSKKPRGANASDPTFTRQARSRNNASRPHADPIRSPRAVRRQRHALTH